MAESLSAQKIVKHYGGVVALSDGNLEVYVVGTNGGTVYNLTRNPSPDRYPDW